MEHRLLSMASNELAAAQDQMLLLGRKTAIERVASFLVSLSDRGAARGLPASPLPLPMTRGEIADYLGLTIETISRAFTKLRKQNLIALEAINRCRSRISKTCVILLSAADPGDLPAASQA